MTVKFGIFSDSRPKLLRMANKGNILKLSIVLIFMLAACVTTDIQNYEISSLDEITIRSIRDNIDSGNPFLAVQDISALERTSDDVSANEIDALYADATEAIGNLFRTAVSENKYSQALSIFRSAQIMGVDDQFPDWNEVKLKIREANGYLERGNFVAGFLLFRKMLNDENVEREDFVSFGEAAIEGGMMNELYAIVDAMTRREMVVPESFAAGAFDRPRMAEMIDGTVTIWVNKGIKLEKGVGYPDRVIGSGFFIDRRGYVLTNYHVIESEVNPKYEGYSRLYVRLSKEEKERIPAQVVGWDSVFDLALLKVEVEPDFVFSFGVEDSPGPGERIFAIGSPAGLTNTITSGIISAEGRRFLQMGDTVQVDVPINPGNSGGPLLDANGDLAGIVFAGIEQFEGINFAIPVKWIIELLPRLYGGGRAELPWIGVAVDEQSSGLAVTYVLPGEPAQRSGLEIGDVITHLNGKEIDDIADFQRKLLEYAPETLVKLNWKRGDEEVDAILALTPRPELPTDIALRRDVFTNLFGYLFGMQVRQTGTIFWDKTYAIDSIYLGGIADEAGLSVNDPLVVQSWIVDEEYRVAILQIVVKKKKAAFTERAVQLAAYLEVDSFL